MSYPSPETREDLHTQLGLTIYAAVANGVDIEGSYAFLTVDDSPNWEVEIVRVASPTRLAGRTTWGHGLASADGGRTEDGR